MSHVGFTYEHLKRQRYSEEALAALRVSAATAGGKFASVDLEQLKKLQPELVALYRDHLARLQAISASPRVTLRASTNELHSAHAAAQAQRDDAKRETLLEIESLHSRAEELREGARQDIGKALGRPAPKSQQEALLAELREQRAWQRIKPRLDAAAFVADEVGRIARDAAVNADADTLA